MLGKSLVLWVSFGVVAVAVGAVREKLLVERVGELAAHQIGTLLVCAAIALIVAAALPRLKPTALQALGIGALWVGLTVVLEFGVFHYLAGVSWQRLLADYDLSRGRLWPLVLVTELVSPWAARR